MTKKKKQEGELRQLLIELTTLLDGVAEPHWAEKARAIAGTPTIDIDEVVSWYGGMGSLNDLMIARVNGHSVEGAQEEPLNDRLEELRNKICGLASALRP